jgi:hypothetical protein
MHRCLILLTSLIATAAAAAPAWTWVDESGLRHFSDRPVPGASRIDLPETQTFQGARAPRAASPQPAATPASGTAQERPAQPYTAFNIVSPSHQQTLWNIGGTLNMQLDIQPALQPGHRLDAILDGEHIEIRAQGNSLSIPNVFRGAHTIQAVIVDESGREVVRSLAITVNVQQTSIQNPNNPNNRTGG